LERFARIFLAMTGSFSGALINLESRPLAREAKVIRLDRAARVLIAYSAGLRLIRTV